MLKKLYTHYLKRSFFNKILLAYSIITIVSIFILAEVIMLSFIDILVKKELNLNQQIITRVSSYVDKNYRSALTVYQRMYESSRTPTERPLLFFEPAGKQNPERELRVKGNLENLLAASFQMDPSINDIVIKRYSDDDWFIMENRQRILREPYQIPVDLSLVNDKPVSGFTIQKAHEPRYRNNQRTVDIQVYSMAAMIMSSDLTRQLGELYVEFNSEHVKADYREYAQNLKGYILILTKDGNVIFDSSGRYYGNPYPYFTIIMQEASEVKLDVESVVNLAYPADADVIVAGIIPKAEIDTVSSMIRKTVYLVSLICILASLFLSFMSTSVTSRRVRSVTDAMKKLHNGDLSTRIAMIGQDDELGQIAASFNAMCDDLQRYINKAYLAEIKQKNAQMNALQSQINPHFLYNTLEAIRMRAVIRGDEDAGEMIHLLAVLFRSTIREEMIIEVRDEIRYCNMYLELFKIRFGDRLTTTMDVEVQLLSYGIIKHLLQPVVENYMIHGFDPDREDNRITITGRRESSDVVFTVEDNGVGINPETLEVLRASLRQGDSGNNIGLPNVNERIKLIYGDQYGLDIDSYPGQGTKVMIRIQCQSIEELKRICTRY